MSVMYSDIVHEKLMTYIESLDSIIQNIRGYTLSDNQKNLIKHYSKEAKDAANNCQKI